MKYNGGCMVFFELYREMFASDLSWDKDKTAQRLEAIRKGNENFKKYVCKHSRLYKHFNEPHREEPCPNNYNCETCTEFYQAVSRASAARCFSRQQRDFYDLENGINVTLEKILYYAYMAKLPLEDVIVLTPGYCFVNGVITKLNKGELKNE